MTYQLVGKIRRSNKSASVDAVEEFRCSIVQFFLYVNHWQLTGAHKCFFALVALGAGDSGSSDGAADIEDDVFGTLRRLSVKPQTVSNYVSCVVSVTG